MSHPLKVCCVLVSLLVLGLAGETAAQAVPYSVTITGLDRDLEEAVRNAIDAVQLQDEPPASRVHLRRRATRDLDKIKDVMNSRAYYGAEVGFEIRGETPPLELVFHVLPGERYPLAQAEFVAPHGFSGPTPAWPAIEAAGLVLGAPALAGPLLDAPEAALRSLQENGYPFPTLGKHRIVVDHDAREVRATFTINPGPKAVMGAPRIEGLENVKPEVITRDLPWEPGDPYRQSLLRAAQRNLYGTNLFAVARVEPVNEVENGQVPIRFELSERPQRTVTFGLRYETTRGAGASSSWEHRNMRGRGEILRLQGDFSQEGYTFETSYRFPYFRAPGEQLELSLGTYDVHTNAYDLTELRAQAMWEKRLSDPLKIYAGLRASSGEVTQLEQIEDYALIALPLAAEWNKSNDALDPTRGYKLRLALEPYFGSANFTRVDATVSHYLPLGSERTVFASRLRVGTTWGAELYEIPAQERYYAGGGGSIRGYPYLTAGALRDDDPIGGRSLLEAAIELRQRVTDDLSVVAFVDAGSYYANIFPDFEEDLRYGAGVGIRYKTPLGPLRFDMAVPLKKRDVDDAFAIYIAFGQTF